MSSILASLDMSLDDLIATKKKGRGNQDGRPPRGAGGGRGAGPAAGGGGPMRTRTRQRRREEPYARNKAANDGDDEVMMDVEDETPAPAPAKKGFAAKRREAQAKAAQDQSSQGKKKGSIFSRLGKAKDVPTTVDGTKLLVRNLKFDILEDDIRELFSTIGKVNKVEVVYDRSGRSRGLARVWFARRADAEKAIKQYDGRTLDGQPMQIALDADKNVRDGLFGTALAKQDEDGVTFKVNLGGRKPERRGRRGPGGRGPGAIKSAEDLDNEMDSYMKEA